MSLQPGTRLGPYEILSPLGSGGMGEVWKAKDSRLDRFVAVKVLPEQLGSNAEALARFEREAKAVAALNHPNILSIFDTGSHEGVAFAVMELLEGESLRDRLVHGPLPPRKAAELAIQMARGLAAAHDKGLIHRDLKPDNLWVTADGRLKILDFGLAKPAALPRSISQSFMETEALGQAQPVNTQKGLILGTMGYMSPEQVRGEGVDARSDIFSFGVVLFEMLTGRRAFARPTAAETIAAILKEDPPDLDDTSKPIPPGLRRILDHCLEKSPASRFHDAHDLAFALESASGQSMELEVLLKPKRRPFRFWPWALGLLLLPALAGAWWLGRSAKPTLAFKQITFRRGNVLRARFTPDGQNIVYSAAWDGHPSEIFMSRMDGSGVRAIGLARADLLAVNGRGELLILLKSSQWTGTSASSGTLALATLDGGTPREILGRVKGADFAPDGQTLAVIFQDQDGGPQHLDYPLGTRLLTSNSELLGAPRISPDGGRVAFVHATTALGAVGTEGGSSAKRGIAVVDRAGKRRDLSVEGTVWDEYLVWSRDGKELYYATRAGLRAVDLEGRVRVLTADATPSLIHDLSPQGRMLLERELYTTSSEVRLGGQSLDLGWQENTYISGFSRDGSLALLFETGGNDTNKNRPLLRRFDHSPPKVLAPGIPQDLNPSGDLALVFLPGEQPKLVAVPTGLGAPRELGLAGWAPTGGRFAKDGHRVFATARQGAGPLRLLSLPVDGGPGSLLPGSIQNVKAAAPDGRSFLCVDAQGRPSLAGEDGVTVRALPWTLEPGEAIVDWLAPDEALLTHPEDALHLRLERVELSTGRRTVWQRLVPPDPGNVTRLYNVRVSGDGQTIGYTYTRILVSDLLLAEGLQ
ncbi:MAG: protein kinase [Holophagaceae bacterium]|nr:protein kinase [Holophagaceae bacterium]